MIIFSDISDCGILDQCYRPLCFSAPGSDFWGMQMFDLTSGLVSTSINLQLGLQGTCTLIEYRNHHFVFFSRHQIALIPNENLEEFSNRMNGLHVLMDDGRNGWNLPINNLIFSFDTIDDGDEDDLVIAVVESRMMLPFMFGHFFPVFRTPFGKVGERVLVGGYPMHAQEILMQTDGNRTVKAAKSGKITQRTSQSLARIEYSVDSESLDGFSGGPVFSFRVAEQNLNDVKFAVFIDGMIQRGGNGFIHYLTIERILDKIDDRYFCAQSS